MILPSGSKLGLAFQCAHPWTSGSRWPRDDDPSRFALGNAAHDYQEAWPDGDVRHISDVRDLNVTNRRRLMTLTPHIHNQLSSVVESGGLMFREVAIAYHVELGTARVIERASHRDYSGLLKGELACTLDVIVVWPGRVLVADLKTAAWRRSDDASWQIKFGALAVARLIGANEVDTSLWYVAEDGIRADSYTLDEFDLDTAATDLRRLWGELHRGPTPPVPGAHCVDMYCPLAGRCAATRAALAEVGQSATVRIASAEDAARIWDLLPAAEAAIKAAKAQIREMAGREPIKLRSGKRLVLVEQSRETVSLDRDSAQMVVEAGAVDALESSTSKAALERALGKQAARSLIDELRKVGAIRESTFTVMKEEEKKTA